MYLKSWLLTCPFFFRSCRSRILLSSIIIRYLITAKIFTSFLKGQSQETNILVKILRILLSSIIIRYLITAQIFTSFLKGQSQETNILAKVSTLCMHPTPIPALQMKGQ
jgi:hypothetical protein